MIATKQSGRLSTRTAPLARGMGWVVDGFRYLGRDALAWLAIILLLLLALPLSFALLFLLTPLLTLTGVVIAWFVLLFLAWPLFVGGLYLGLARVNRGGRLATADLFAGFSHPGRGDLLLLGLASLLFQLLIALMVEHFVGSFAQLNFLTGNVQDLQTMLLATDITFLLGLLLGLLLHVALMLPVMMLLWFAPTLVVLENKAALPAMHHSFMGCWHNVGAWTVFGLVGLLGYGLLTVLTLGLALPVLAASGPGAIFSAYKDIFHRV